MALPKDIKSGDPITAKFLNEIIQEVRRSLKITGSGGIEVTSSATGINIRLAASRGPVLVRGLIKENLTNSGEADCDLYVYDPDTENYTMPDEPKTITCKPGLPITQLVPAESVVWMVQQGSMYFVIQAECA